MNEFQVLITIQIAGFGFMGAILLCIWNHLNKRIDGLETRLSTLYGRINKLEMDMVEIKTILRMKECCMIKDDRQIHKAE